MDLNGNLRRRFNKSFTKSDLNKNLDKNDLHTNQTFNATNSIYTAIGLICMYKLSDWCFSYLKLLHENDLWFSKLKVGEATLIVFRQLK